MGMMEDCHCPDYDFYQLFTEPAAVGHFACARERTYVIGVHNERSMILHDPWDLNDAISECLSKKVSTRVRDYFVASSAEVQLEALDRARTRRITYRPDCSDLSYLLTHREANALEDYKKAYQARFGFPAESDDDLILFLGDDPDFSLTWSASSKKIPTYRLNSANGIYWSCKHQRWLTAKERLVSLGWPVLPAVADAMSVPVVGALDVKRAATLSGNGMHFLCTGVQQLIALACFGSSSSCDMFRAGPARGC